MERELFELNVGDVMLSATHWKSVTNPRAIIAIIHGYGEHQMRYEYVCLKFTEEQFDVFTFDLRGHGKSPGKRGHFSDYKLLLDDVDILLDKINTNMPDVPLILYGHSFGGNLVANYLIKRSTNYLTGAIITSPWLKLAFEPPRWKVLLAKMARRIVPSMTEKNGLDANDLSSDPQIVSSYQNDPLVHDKISAAAFHQIYKAGLWVLTKQNVLKLPVLLVHGGHDKITSHKASEKFAINNPNEVDLKIWSQLRHETHNESKKEEVILFNINWIKNLLN